MPDSRSISLLFGNLRLELDVPGLLFLAPGREIEKTDLDLVHPLQRIWDVIAPFADENVSLCRVSLLLEPFELEPGRLVLALGDPLQSACAVQIAFGGVAGQPELFLAREVILRFAPARFVCGDRARFAIDSS